MSARDNQALQWRGSQAMMGRLPLQARPAVMSLMMSLSRRVPVDAPLWPGLKPAPEAIVVSATCHPPRSSYGLIRRNEGHGLVVSRVKL